MSYEGKMFQKLDMPPREKVEEVLLLTLFNHNGTITEFGPGEEIVEEIANAFDLSEKQRNSYLETIYRKENRIKKSNLWHRLLFRAADNLAKQKLISRPTQTFQLTNNRKWMLTEEGLDKALNLLNLSSLLKEELSIRSYEVEKLVIKLKEKVKPENYSPINKGQKKSNILVTSGLRNRSFRQAVMEIYDYKCTVCGLKIYSPKNYQWEVQAAHIVPHSSKGKDDIWNGISLCRFHHWAFDVGWFSFDNDLHIISSRSLSRLTNDMGKIWNFDIMSQLNNPQTKIYLPTNKTLWPDPRAIEWHRKDVLQ